MIDWEPGPSYEARVTLCLDAITEEILDSLSPPRISRGRISRATCFYTVEGFS